MEIKNTVFNGRKAWEVDNGMLKLVMEEGGGHIAGLTLHDKPRINPLWVPVWKSIEPWHYRAKDRIKYESKLLSAISGHNLCLGWFGFPSKDETNAGLGCHGEAPIARWKLTKRHITGSKAGFTCSADLPVTEMKVIRSVYSKKGSNVIRVKDQVRNCSRRDIPFTMCEHVTIGPPFLEKGVTVFDMPATKAHTFPGNFSDCHRFKEDKSFKWPEGPGAKGEKIDMRVISKQYRKSSDFTTQLMDTSMEDAWFSAINPKQGVLIAYIWKRTDFPWVGNWEENYGRKTKPWAGKSLTRGMEFMNTPWPTSLREAVTMGKFQGQSTYKWLPARGKLDMEYAIIIMNVEKDIKGVADIRRNEKGFSVDLII